jgi:formate hydrogenlyase subunit 4
VLVLVAVSPLVVGLMRTVRARLEGRVGAGIAQPWRDLRKLLAKESLRADGTSWVSVAGPVLLMASSLVVCALTPVLGTVTFDRAPDDLFVVVSVLLLGTVAVALVGLDAGSAFGGMGSSRHMTIAALVEPTLLLAAFALSARAGSTSLAAIVNAGVHHPDRLVSPASLLAAAALAVAVLAETGRMPVDNPATHLELTMVHEAMVLEYAGRDLALVELASAMRLSLLLGLLANLFVPWGVATTTGWAALAVGVAALVVKLSLLGGVLAAGEVLMAKVRLFRVPELLAGSFVLGLLAVTASYVLT